MRSGRVGRPAGPSTDDEHVVHDVAFVFAQSRLDELVDQLDAVQVVVFLRRRLHLGGRDKITDVLVRKHLTVAELGGARFSVLNNPVIADVDELTIISLQGGAHVKPQCAGWHDTQPVTSGWDEAAVDVDARPLGPTAGKHIDDQAMTTAALLLFAWSPLSHAQTTQPKLEYLMTYKAILEPAQAIDGTLIRAV